MSVFSSSHKLLLKPTFHSYLDKTPDDTPDRRHFSVDQV